MTVAYCNELQLALIPQVLTEGLSAKLSEMRTIKSADEVEKIITAQRITERAYTEVLNILRPGVTERKVAVELEHLIKLYGGERVAFDLICITGYSGMDPEVYSAGDGIDNESYPVPRSFTFGLKLNF